MGELPPRPTSMTLPSPPFDRERERFPSMHLQEDFVRITGTEQWRTSDEPTTDSLCKSCLRALYPSTITRQFKRIPKKLRYPLICCFFCLLLIVATCIVLLCIFVFTAKPNNEATTTTTAAPVWPRGHLTEITEFLVDVDESLVQSLSPDPINKGRYFGFDGRSKVTIIHKDANGLKTETVNVLGLPNLPCNEWRIVAFPSDKDRPKWEGDSIESSEIAWCCIETESVTCSAFTWSRLKVAGSLVFVLLELDGLHMTVQSRSGAMCTLQHFIISNVTVFSESSADCGWREDHTTDKVFANASFNKSSLTVKALVEQDGVLSVGSPFSASSRWTVSAFGGQTSNLPPLHLAPPSSSDPHAILFGIVSVAEEQRCSVARVKGDVLSVLYFTVSIANDYSFVGSFFDSFGSFHLWYKKNGQIWMNFYSFGWDN